MEMLRREALTILTGAAAARGAASLARFFDDTNGAAVLVDVRTHSTIAVHNAAVANGFPAPPGSTIKPFVLAALLKTAKLSPEETYPCPGRLLIAGRSFNCSHPRLDAPMRVDTALAYSCNCFVAHMAERFESGALTRELDAAGLREDSGRLAVARTPDATRLQALGEGGIEVTTSGLASAWRGLALNAPAAILSGLEGAVEFGTAQRAQVAGIQVAGKTGSVHTDTGARIAWFAGFLPSRAPRAVVVVMLQGRSGGSDAAPAAGRILAAWRQGQL
jgi:peptidoglycan glycosyltransferase